jgi:DNA (cytosine-5)-methyltransferase 1
VVNFIDLYAGIGGIRFGFEQVGAECIFSSEWNKFAQKTYQAFHGEIPFGDISNVDFDKDIPDHNILTAGFPCQPFSLAGVSKKRSLGRKHGFEDPTQGTEFFKIKEILRIKQPDAFLLENVKNLKSHDNKNTFAIIEQQLDDVGYYYKDLIIDSSFWVPQHRERIYIIGFKKKFKNKSFLDNLKIKYPETRLYELDRVLQNESFIRNKFDHKYTLSKGTWAALQNHKEKHSIKGNGFGYGLIRKPHSGQITRTLSARYYKDGAEILINQDDCIIPRRLTPLEVCRLQGFPKKCEKFFDGRITSPCSDVQIYKQFGNSVTIPVIKTIAEIIIEELKRNGIK